ncbi:hypothetical protein LX36DRAFT_342072 [Colletotrichum falcatum]|nr:hypothetical protein LX36DRAFT_342072 [Colletotrichum falcatum]
MSDYRLPTLNDRRPMPDARCSVLGAQQHWRPRSHAPRARRLRRRRVVARCLTRSVAFRLMLFGSPRQCSCQPAWKIPKARRDERRHVKGRGAISPYQQVSAVESSRVGSGGEGVVGEVVGKKSRPIIRVYVVVVEAAHSENLKPGVSPVTRMRMGQAWGREIKIKTKKKEREREGIKSKKVLETPRIARWRCGLGSGGSRARGRLWPVLAAAMVLLDLQYRRLLAPVYEVR